MKDCKEIQDLLSLFLEGEAAPPDRAAVEAHLEGCSDCRSDLALLRQTVAALRSVPDLPPPAAILRGVRDEISPVPARGFFERLFRKGAWVGIPIGALAMAVLGIAAFVLQDRYPELQKGPETTAPRQTVAPAAEEEADRSVKEEAAALPEKPAVTEAPPPPTKDDSADMAAPAGKREGGSDIAAARDAPANRDKVPPAPAPARSAPAAPPGDTYRSGEDSAADTKDIRKLLESSELLSPARRENGRSTVSGIDGAPAGPALGYGSEARVADRDGADDSPATGPGQAAAPEMKKALKRKARTNTPAETALPAGEPLQEAADGMERAPGLEEFTEILTLLSLRGDDMAPLRRFIGSADGQLLELKSLDPSQSRKIARPFGDDIPPGQTIGRGWRIRALLPAGKVAGFIDAVAKEPQFRILNRTQSPAARRPAPGMQSLEIVVVR